MNADLYNSSGIKPQMDASDEVVSQLFPHQREALAWMFQRENSSTLPPFWVTTQTPAGLLYTNR
jgi:SWI/SNF-related matrix-associated actin-dependent regulator of chromatin subfamily A3